VSQAIAGANVVNVASSFASTMIRMGMLPAASVISNAGAIEGGGIGIRAPGVSVGIGIDRYWGNRPKPDTNKAAEKSAALFRMQTQTARSG